MDVAVSHTEERYAAANGLRFCYDMFGDEAAPKLLLIMGLGAQMTLWDDDFCAGLAARGYHIIRFDNRDAGRSSWLSGQPQADLLTLMQKRMAGEPIEAPYLLADMAADTVGLLDALGIESAHIVGASMGGMIAQEMAIRHSARVRTLTSIMSTTGAPDLPPPTPEATAVLMAPPPATLDEYIEAFCASWKVLRAGSFAADEARDPARAAGFWERGLNPAGTARQLVAILASGDRTLPLHGVSAPTLVIHGPPDPLVPIEAGRATAAAVPGARLVEIPTMGHALPMDIWPTVFDAVASHCR